ncbi:MAG: 50S ribosomal protein L24 [Fimbriimonadales bacterium]
MYKKIVAPKQSVKIKLKTGDTVEIIAGKDKGARGRIIKVMPKRMMVLVEGHEKDKDGVKVPLNAVTKHQKPRTMGEQGKKTRMAAPLHISKVMLIDPHSDKPTRVGRRVEEGKLVRYAKASNETIDVK